jgi:hypothetical protein
MPVTKEQVVEEAKKLGIELDDAKINAFVLIGELPKKDSAGSHTDDGGGDGGGDDDPDHKGGKGAEARIKKLVDARKATQAALDAANAELKKFKDAQDAAARKDAEAKGQYDKLIADADKATKAAEAAVAAAKERVKETLITNKLESELLKSGVPADRIEKAVKLFDKSKIAFSWTDEAAMTHEIEDFAPVIADFKKDNDFLFLDAGDGDPNLQGHRPPTAGGKTTAEKKKEELKKKYPSVF